MNSRGDSRGNSSMNANIHPINYSCQLQYVNQAADSKCKFDEIIRFVFLTFSYFSVSNRWCLFLFLAIDQLFRVQVDFF